MTGRKIFAALIVGVGLSGQLVSGHPLTAVANAAPPARHAPEKAAADVRARELFQKGDAAYAEGRYEEALAAFQEAYDLSGRPQLLFNVSNALERLGRYADAVEALDKYLASGKAKDREIVQKRLANLKRRVEEQKKAEERAREDEEKKRAAERESAEQAPRPPDKSEAAQPGTSPAPASEKPTRVLPIALLGAGGAALATAGVFGALTLSARSDVDAACKSGPSGRFCSADAGPAIDRDKTFSLVTDIALVSGVVLGAAGLYFLLTGDDGRASMKVGSRVRSSTGTYRERAIEPLRIQARPAGAGVEVVGTF